MKVIITLLSLLLTTSLSAKEYKVLSYNIKALPLIAGGGKNFQFKFIGEKLKEMKEHDGGPDIILIQEAFCHKSIKTINSIAKYKNIYKGPHRFGLKILGAGLVVLTDLELEIVSNIGFPSLTCAGWDCFAAKGYQILKLKNTNTYIMNTHLNANNKALGRFVTSRSKKARLNQVRLVREWINRNIPKDAKIIFGGDFNLKPLLEDEYEVLESLDFNHSASLCLESDICELTNNTTADDVFLNSIDMILLRNIDAEILSVEKNFKLPIPGTDTIPSDHHGYYIRFEAEL